ncbi:MAG: LPP20 family lipoprotein [Gammaproteobacteria bacterium]|nr:LPP20 family lipoprotein [Gammaproteobacteria bacterium]
MRKFWVIIFVIALTACKSQAVVSKSGDGKQPDWVNGDSFNYPHSAYIVGKASASNRETAKNRALANLSKTFELKIQEESKTLSDVQSQVVNGKESYSKDTRLTQNIKIETDKVLEGARVAELWEDKKVFEFHALAVLERSQAGRNIRQQITELDQSTRSELKRARSNSDKLLAMAAMNQAFKQQLERQTLQKTLKIIDLKGVGNPSEWNLSDMRAELESQLLALKITDQVESSDLTQLSRLVKGAMSKAGFPAVKGAADYKLLASAELTDVGMRSGWYWVRASITVKLTEAASGKVRGTHSWSFKTSANSKEVAVTRLVTKADNAMKNDMKDVILDFATSVGS